MNLPAPITVSPQSTSTEQAIAGLPAGPGVYTIRMAGGGVHLSSCAYLRARVRRLLPSAKDGPEKPTVSGRQRLLDQIGGIDCWPTGSRLETWLLLLELGRSLYPSDYDSKLRLRRPWFVGLSSDRFPRIMIFNRLPSDLQTAYGPFPIRDAAAAYAEGTAGLFQIRKCTEPLLPTPDHPGCIYGEMNQCLRPCQCAVSDEEYTSEVLRAHEFLRTNGAATRTSLLLARDRASEELDFEMASHIHKRLERVAGAIALREQLAGGMQGFGGVAITNSLQAGSVRLWPMRDSTWLDPIDIPVGGEQAEARSLDARVRDAWSSATKEKPDPSTDRSAHLAILMRWYRSSYRDGEWVADTPGKGLSYRKIVGAISRLLKS